MKKSLMVILTSGLLMVGSPLMPYVFAQTSSQATGTAAPGSAVKNGHHDHERHPAIHRAINKLREAKRALEKAAHDFSGHKAAALQAIDHALKELQEALRSDKK